LKKDLFKNGRPINEYLNSDGSMKVHCFTCLHRYSISEAPLGDFLCSGGYDKHMKCNPNYEKNLGKSNDLFSYIFWKPRVSNNFLDDEEFLIK